LENENFIEESKRIVDIAGERGIVLRIMGATAFVIHCPKFAYLHKALERKLTDIDLVAYGKQKNDVYELFKGLGYVTRKHEMLLYSSQRRVFFHDQAHNRMVDVFFDKLEMCHEIDFRDRLEIDYPTIPLANLLLEKTQIVEINEKDVIDTVVLLREHEVGESEVETLNSQYVAKILCEDWGFYYTVRMNLGKIRDFLPKYGVLTQEDRLNIGAKIDRLLERIEKAPKSSKWKLRSKIGPRKKWYKDVEYPQRMYEHY